MAVARWIDWMCEFGAAILPVTKFVKSVAYYETPFPFLGNYIVNYKTSGVK